MKFVIPILAVLIGLSFPKSVAAEPITDDISLAGMSKALDCYYEENESAMPYLILSNLSKSEEEVLQRIVEAEATGADIRAKMNVVSCVINRMMDDEFSDNLTGVVFAKSHGEYQFSPIKDGRYYTVEVTESTKLAIDLVRFGGLTHRCLYFCTPDCRSAISGFHSKLRFVFSDSIHNYYSEDKT